MPNLRCVFHVRSHTKAFIVVTHMHNAHHSRSIVGQSRQVETVSHILLTHHFGCHRKPPAYDGIHRILHPAKLTFG